MIVLFIGPPGAGKGTQADRAVKDLGYVKLSTGDLLRDNIQRKTHVGLQVEEIIRSGRLVDDTLVLNVLESKLESLKSTAKIILDGFPRTLNQALLLDERYPDEIDLVVHFDASVDDLVSRISGRLICSKCQNSASLSMVDELGGVCKSCNEGVLTRRPDDQPEKVKTRIGIYNDQTLPLLDLYKKQGKYIRVDAGQTADLVAEEVFNIFERRSNFVNR